MKKKKLRKSDIRELNTQTSKYDYEAGKKDNVEIIEDDFRIVSINDKPMFFYYENKIIPTLKALLDGVSLKKVVVDMGAVKFLASGADVMRPGITDIEDGIEPGDPVAVVDENNNKPIAVCIAMFSSDDMRDMDSGKVLKNIHYVGDLIWNFRM